MPLYRALCILPAKIALNSEGKPSMGRFSGKDPDTLEPTVPIYVCDASTLRSSGPVTGSVVDIHALIEGADKRSAFGALVSCLGPINVLEFALYEVDGIDDRDGLIAAFIADTAQYAAQ